MTELDRALVVRPGEGERVGNVELLARTAETPRFNLAIVTIAPHQHGPPAHVHDDEDDAFYVLDDAMTFILGGEEVEAAAGTFVLVPPGVEHTFENRTGNPVRLLNVHAPAGWDDRIRD